MVGVNGHHPSSIIVVETTRLVSRSGRRSIRDFSGLGTRLPHFSSFASLFLASASFISCVSLCLLLCYSVLSRITTTMAMAMLRILCMHDGNSNAAELKQQFELLGKKLYEKHAIDLVYVDSPITTTSNHHQHRVWWEQVERRGVVDRLCYKMTTTTTRMTRTTTARTLRTIVLTYTIVDWMHRSCCCVKFGRPARSGEY